MKAFTPRMGAILGSTGRFGLRTGEAVGKKKGTCPMTVGQWNRTVLPTRFIKTRRADIQLVLEQGEPSRLCFEKVISLKVRMVPDG